MFFLSETARILMITFAIIAVGYSLGRICICGVKLGAAGVFVVGLLFGHLGAELPTILQTTGLILFITSVGLSAGPGFFQRMRNAGLAYAALCVTTAAVGGAVCFILIRVGGIEAPLAVGVMTGAFTTSPGFAAAKEAASAADAVKVAAGYGIAYPVGVICKVIFVQLIPRLLHADMEQERALIALPAKEEKVKCQSSFRIDKLGFFVMGVDVVLGIALGSVIIPLPGGGQFSLGMTGGPLVVGLLLGFMGRIGPVSLQIDPAIVAPMKEIGCALFFAGAGVEGGHGIAGILSQYGALPLVFAFLLVSIPLLAGFAMFRFVLKLPLLNGLGAMTASMTCTPSLAILTQLAGTDDVAAAYATTYPIALIILVLVVQFLMLL